MTGREAETLKLLILAEASLVEQTVVLEQIGLTNPAQAEAIEEWLGDRVRTVSYCIDIAMFLTCNLIVVRAVSKCQSRAGAEDLTVSRQ